MWLAKESVLWKRGWYTFAPVSALHLFIHCSCSDYTVRPFCSTDGLGEMTYMCKD